MNSICFEKQADEIMSALDVGLILLKITNKKNVSD